MDLAHMLTPTWGASVAPRIHFWLTTCGKHCLSIYSAFKQGRETSAEDLVQTSVLLWCDLRDQRLMARVLGMLGNSHRVSCLVALTLVLLQVESNCHVDCLF